MIASVNLIKDTTLSADLTDEALQAESLMLEARRETVRQQLLVLSNEFKGIDQRKNLIQETLATRKVARDTTPDWAWLLTYDEITSEDSDDVRSKALKTALETHAQSEPYKRLSFTGWPNESSRQHTLVVRIKRDALNEAEKEKILKGLQTVLPFVKTGLPNYIVSPTHSDNTKYKFVRILPSWEAVPATYYLAINEKAKKFGYELRSKPRGYRGEKTPSVVIYKTTSLATLLEFTYAEISKIAALETCEDY